MNPEKEKIQIIVDSDLDGICSAAIMYGFLKKFYPEIETVYSIHTGKQHGLSDDIIIEDNVTLVLIPDAGSNETKRCSKLFEDGIDVICLDHHIIEYSNPYASIVSCMDGVYPNTHLCGAAVTWLFLWGFCSNCISNCEKYHLYLQGLLDLVATATISDIMEVTNEDNMYFIQHGLKNIQSPILRMFLIVNEVNISDVTIEDIKFKVAPSISAMIRVGTLSEKTLLFRAFICDYEEFDYEKRGSLYVGTEDIYERVVRFCKNAKSRQDRAKQKLLDECKIHEYPHILLVEYTASKPSTLTGLVANELANQYSKPCFVYRVTEYYDDDDDDDDDEERWFSGSVRNYDGSPIPSIKQLLSNAFKDNGRFQGHDNALGASVFAPSVDCNADYYADIIEKYINSQPSSNDDTIVGYKSYILDFAISADDITDDFVRELHTFEHYSGFGFPAVTALVTDIKVAQENFNTMGKFSLNWKIRDKNTGVSYIKFKVDRNNDDLIKAFDDVNWDSEDDYGNLYDTFGKYYTINAICTFGLNMYRGEIYYQCIVKDYKITGVHEQENVNDWDLDLGI